MIGPNSSYLLSQFILHTLRELIEQWIINCVTKRFARTVEYKLHYPCYLVRGGKRTLGTNYNQLWGITLVLTGCWVSVNECKWQPTHIALCLQFLIDLNLKFVLNLIQFFHLIIMQDQHEKHTFKRSKTFSQVYFCWMLAPRCCNLSGWT